MDVCYVSTFFPLCLGRIHPDLTILLRVQGPHDGVGRRGLPVGGIRNRRASQQGRSRGARVSFKSTMRIE